MSYAGVQDVADRLGRAITDPLEVAQVQAWLDDVEAQILARFTRASLVLVDQLALDDPSVETLVRVECAVVIRRIQNPSGLTSVTRTLDDATITERHEGSGAGWDMLEAEWLDLFPGVFSSGAFSTSPGFEPDYADSWNWPV